MKNNIEGKCITKLVTTLLYLRKVKTNRKTGLVPIYLRITLDGVRKEISLKRKVNLKDWDSKLQVVLGKSEEVLVLNAYLSGKKKEITKIYSLLYLSDKAITPQIIVDKLRGSNVKKETLLSLYGLFTVDFAEQVAAGERTEARLEKYGYCSEKIKGYLKYKFKVQDVSLEKLTLSFLEGFGRYLRIEESLAHNTVVGYCKMLKAILKFGVKHKILKVCPFSDYTESFVETKRVCLSDEEIARIEDMEFADTSLQRVKDLFLLSVYSGISYIDARNLNSSNLVQNLHGKDWLDYARQKSKEPVAALLLY